MLEEQQIPVPYGFIQWKGTDVCMDINCQCGTLSHVDGEFGYYAKCYKCGQVYQVGYYVKLYPIEGTPDCTPLMDADADAENSLSEIDSEAQS
jgi:hypothetical protein